MSCDKYYVHMMHYMDGAITTEEERLLREHIKTCSACKEDFEIYEEMLKGFSETEIINAPDGFEEAVMSKIQSLEHTYEPMPAAALGITDRLTTKEFFDLFLCYITGLCLLAFGGSITAVTYKTEIISFFTKYPQTWARISYLAPTLNRLEAAFNGLDQAIRLALSDIGTFAIESQILLLVAFCALAVVQYVFFYRKKLGGRGIKS